MTWESSSLNIQKKQNNGVQQPIEARGRSTASAWYVSSGASSRYTSSGSGIFFKAGIARIPQGAIRVLEILCYEFFLTTAYSNHAISAETWNIYTDYERKHLATHVAPFHVFYGRVVDLRNHGNTTSPGRVVHLLSHLHIKRRTKGATLEQ